MKVASKGKYIIKIKKDKCDLNVVLKKRKKLFYKTVFVDDIESVYTTNIVYNLGFKLDEDAPDYYENLSNLAITIYEKLVDKNI